MKITIHDMKQCRKALSLCKHSIVNRSCLPVLTCVKITADKNLSFAATDCDTFTIYTFQRSGLLSPVEVSESGSVCLPYNVLYDAAQSPSLQVKTEKDNKVTLTYGETKVNVSMIAEEEFPSTPATCRSAESPLPDLKDTLVRLAPLASTDDKLRLLNSYYFDTKNGAIVTTNGRELCKIKTELPRKMKPFIIPTTQLFAKYIFKNASISLSPKDKAVCFADGPLQHVVKQVEGIYPRYELFIPAPGEHTCRLNSSAVQAMHRSKAEYGRCQFMLNYKRGEAQPENIGKILSIQKQDDRVWTLMKARIVYHLRIPCFLESKDK